MQGRGLSSDEVRQRMADRLGALAAGTDTRIDESVFVELANYSVHEQVRDLPDEDLERVLEGIGELAVSLPARDISGEHVREVIYALCPKIASTCFGSAITVLETPRGDLGSVFVRGLRERRGQLQELEADLERAVGSDLEIGA